MSAEFPPLGVTRRPDTGRSDFIVIALVALVLVVIAASRREFDGDGVRHLPAVFLSHPTVAASRFLLLPGMLFAAIHPLVAAGWVRSIEEAILPFLWLDVAAGLVWLLALRRWLEADGHGPRARVAALALAGACVPFLRLYSDTTEPQVAAAAVMGGLAFARVRSQRPERAVSAALIVTAVIAAASLVYASLILAVAMVPLVVPRSVAFPRRALPAMAALIALAFGTMVAARMAAGDSARASISSAFLGENNPLLRRFFATPSLSKYAAALVAGPPQAIVGLDTFQGLPLLAADLRRRERTAAAAANIGRLAVGLGVFASLLAVAVRDWRLALAVVAIVALPMLRNNQYTYAKFYILFPAVLAVASTRYRPRLVLAAAGIVAVLNVPLVARDVARGRERFERARALYVTADARTCWFTTGYMPPFWYRWPGGVTGILAALADPVDPAAPPRLTTSLQACFCAASSVWTDTTIESAAFVASLADTFEYRDRNLSSILFRPGDGTTIDAGPPAIHVYSREAQAAACARVRPGSSGLR